MRIGGMASGMDTEKIIRDLMKANRMPLDKITQKKAYLEYQLKDYRNINLNLKTSTYKINDTILRESTFSAKKVSISNPEVVNIKSAGSTSDFSGSISIGQLATQATWQSSTASVKGADTSAAIGDLFGAEVTSINITAPGAAASTTVTFTPEDTIKSVLDKINDKATGVSAFYDSKSGQIAMTAKNSGVGDIKVETTPGSMVVANGQQSGKDAKFTINGLETTRSSNTFEISGFEVTLKQTTGTPTDHGTPITFSSTTDTDKVMDSVTQFVNDYNKMIEELNAKINETKYRGFPPLTDEQKKDMKENEIKLWEEKALSGTLRNDPIISNMLTKMRSAIISSEPGGPNLSDIGITASNNYLDNGKLVINEDKLRAAITEDPEKVSQLLREPKTESSKGGIAVQIRDLMDEGQKAISKRAGSVGAGNSTFTLGNNLKSMNEQINRFEDRLKMTENRLWKQFSAMEQAINRANAQSASLMSALGGG